MINKSFILQNILISLPFIHLYLINRFQITKTETINLLIFSSIYILLFNICRLILRRYKVFKKLEYSAVIIFYLFFNYSNITIFIYFEAFEIIKSIPNYSFLTFVVLLTLCIYLSRHKSFNRVLEFSTVSYSIFVLILFINSLSMNLDTDKSLSKTTEDYLKIEFSEKPDLYFVMYDGLPSLKTMDKYYEYDTNKFINLLVKNNLYNYSLSTSSFGRTHYTVSSMLNMDYIFEDGDVDFVERNNLLQDYINGDTVFENILRNNDYTIYKFGQVFNCNLDKNDICITENIQEYSEKNTVYFDLIMRTPLKIFIEKGYIKINPSLSIGCFESCGDPELEEIFMNINEKNTPKAVFLHFMDTHGPYLLGTDCKLLENPLYDLPKTDILTYQKSLDCAYKKIDGLIQKIDLENDILFIQSDHGPNYDKMEITNIDDLSINQILNRYSIFSISNIENYCKDIDLNNNINTFINFTNCFSQPTVSKLEKKNFLAFGKVNNSVFDISKIVQEIIYNYYK